MKELDKTKKYDLSKLNDEQFSEMLSWLQINVNESWNSWTLNRFKGDNHLYCIYHDDVEKDWNFRRDRVNLTCATELFTSNYEVTMIAEQPKNHIPDVGKKVEQLSISNPKKKWDNMPNESDYLEQPTAYKETSNKLNYELDFNFITQMAERMAQNKHKYEPYNWQKLDNIEDLKQALLRHVLDVLKGNYEDEGREFAHLESIALNAMFINYQLNKNGKI